MREPSGLHRGLSTSTDNSVSCTASPPLVAIVQICWLPPRLDTNAIVRLSGDQVGDVAAWFFALVSCRRFDPSTDISHRFVVALLVSGSQALTVNTTDCPSGDGCGSPTRCIRTMSCTPNGCGFESDSGAVAFGFSWANSPETITTPTKTLMANRMMTTPNEAETVNR